MEIISVIANVCTIASLVVTLFVASKIIKLSNSNNNNSGNIQQGDGTQKIAEGHSIVADNHSHAIYNDYRDAIIKGEIDEFPVLTKKIYPIVIENADKYSVGIAKNTCNLIQHETSNTSCFVVDFGRVDLQPEANSWIGYAVKSLPMRDWRSFVEDDYILQFSYMAAGTISEIWIEITNKSDNKKIHKAKLDLNHENKIYKLKLSGYKKVIKDWKNVDEICFVFFPEECAGEYGTVIITDLVIQKN